MDISKYKWKNRILLVETSSYKDDKYLYTKNIYEKNLKEFHKRYIKMLTKRRKDYKFKISLIGFDGNVKSVFIKLVPNKIYNIVDKMPLGKLMKNNSKIKPKNLSLYSDYNKKTTISGLGFKNKEKANYTIEKIRDMSINYQKQVLNTMIGRANNHPYKTKDMSIAVKILSKRLKELNK